ncbi:hypothetical protein BDZ89DRAFT_1071541 [Hymenopellis radicata]|nr:hypothetical protein BDZ89DRAFT_1071541 [Hymenopellis radicata]
MGTFRPLTTNGKRAADGEEEEEGSVKRQRIEEPEPEPEPEPAKDLELDKTNEGEDEREEEESAESGENPFISLNESLPGKERSEEELVQLRDIALHLLTGGTDPVEYIASHRDDPKPLSYLIAKKSVPAPLWASLVHLNVPRKTDGEPRALNGTCVRGVSVVEWDLVGVKRPGQCTTCNGLERACEYTCVGRPHSKCRECLIRQKNCTVAGTSPVKVTISVPKRRERVEDPETLRATLLKESLDKQREAKARVTKDVWVKVVQLGLDKTTEVDISEWDVSGTIRVVPCKTCVNDQLACEDTAVGADGACRRCSLSSASCNPVTEVEEDNETPEDKVLYFKFAEFHNNKELKNSDKTAWLLNMRGVIAVMSKAKGKQVRKQVGEARWAQIVESGVRGGGGPRVTRWREKRKEAGEEAEDPGCDISGWDLVPTKKTPDVHPCEYTTLEWAAGKCRECILEDRVCARTGRPKPVEVKTNNPALAAFIAALSSEDTAVLRDLALIVPKFLHNKAKMACGEDVWIDMDIVGRANGAGAAGMRMAEWDLTGEEYDPACTYCAGMPCERVRGDQAGSCRRCRLKRRGCSVKDLLPGEQELQVKASKKKGEEITSLSQARRDAGQTIRLVPPMRQPVPPPAAPTPSVRVAVPRRVGSARVVDNSVSSRPAPAVSAPASQAVSDVMQGLLERMERELERKEREVERREEELAEVREECKYLKARVRELERPETEETEKMLAMIRMLEKQVEELKRG